MGHGFTFIHLIWTDRKSSSFSCELVSFFLDKSVKSNSLFNKNRQWLMSGLDHWEFIRLNVCSKYTYGYETKSP